MKKIGIVTTVYGNNWGEVLQAYAMRTAINSYYKNCEAEVINFSGAPYRPFQKPGFENFIDKNEHKKQLFQDFRENEIHIKGEKIYSLSSENVHAYDDYIFGSDGIWNTDVWQVPEFFGSFVTSGVNKIAYAPSISTNPYRESFRKEYFDKYIGTFHYLSVRESCHREFIQQYTDKTVHFVCDPTLLLKRDNYLSLIERIYPDKPSNPYIFYYQPNSPDGAIISLVNKLARMHNLDIVHTFADIPSTVFANRSVSAKFAGPLEFLSYIKDAAIVITRSYHAAIFAIQFQRPVYAYVDKKTGARFESLFAVLNMKERLIYDYMKPEDVCLTYDYQNAYDKLALFRQESLQYLSEALQTEYCI